MASKPLRPCRHPGCCVLVSDGFCEAHRPKREGDDRSAEAREWHRLYSTDLWVKRLRPGQLLREPWCRECAKHGLRVRATDVDHIVDHKGNMDLFSDPNNLESLCHSCHSRKTLREMQKNRSRK